MVVIILNTKAVTKIKLKDFLFQIILFFRINRKENPRALLLNTAKKKKISIERSKHLKENFVFCKNYIYT